MNQCARGSDLIHVVAEAANDHDVHAKAAGAGLQKASENSQNVETDKAGDFFTGCHRISGDRRHDGDRHDAHHEQRPCWIEFFDDQPADDRDRNEYDKNTSHGCLRKH